MATQSNSIGPVRLTTEQRERSNELHDEWTRRMIATAKNENAHPEDRANARAYLAHRGITS